MLEQTVPYFCCALCGDSVNPWADTTWLTDDTLLCGSCGTVGPEDHTEPVAVSSNIHEAITLVDIADWSRNRKAKS